MRRSAGAVLLSRCGRTQQEVATALTNGGHRTSFQAVATWMSGEKKPRVEKRVALEDLLGVPATSWDDPPTKDLPLLPHPRGSSPSALNSSKEPTEPPSGVLAKAVAIERICDVLYVRFRTLMDDPALSPRELFTVAEAGAKLVDQLAKLAKLPLAKITQHPDWPLVRRALREGLRGHPAAARDVEEHLQAIEDSSAA